jgi:hypothetical protein
MKNNSLFIMKEIKRDKEREIFFFNNLRTFPAHQMRRSLSVALP